MYRKVQWRNVTCTVSCMQRKASSSSCLKIPSTSWHWPQTSLTDPVPALWHQIKLGKVKSDKRDFLPRARIRCTTALVISEYATAAEFTVVSEVTLPSCPLRSPNCRFFSFLCAPFAQSRRLRHKPSYVITRRSRAALGLSPSRSCRGRVRLIFPRFTPPQGIQRLQRRRDNGSSVCLSLVPGNYLFCVQPYYASTCFPLQLFH